MGLRLQFSQNIPPLWLFMQIGNLHATNVHPNAINVVNATWIAKRQQTESRRPPIPILYLVHRFCIHVQISVYGDNKQINVAISEISH